MYTQRESRDQLSPATAIIIHVRIYTCTSIRRLQLCNQLQAKRRTRLEQRTSLHNRTRQLCQQLIHLVSHRYLIAYRESMQGRSCIYAHIYARNSLARAAALAPKRDRSQTLIQCVQTLLGTSILLVIPWGASEPHGLIHVSSLQNEQEVKVLGAHPLLWLGFI